MGRQINHATWSASDHSMAVPGSVPAAYPTDCSRAILAPMESRSVIAIQAYLWTKTAHLVFVIAWMAAVLYLPRFLVNLAEAGGDPGVRARLVLMGRRLYRVGHVMFGLATVLEIGRASCRERVCQYV